MSEEKTKTPKTENDLLPYGGLEELTDEQIEKNIKDFPYVMGKLKDC